MRNSSGARGAIAAFVVLLVACLAACTSDDDRPLGRERSHWQPPAPVKAAELAGGKRANIVLITTDDMRADDLRWMPHTRRLLGGKGLTFTDALAPHPLCCPARAEILSGQFAHNNGVHSNSGSWGGHRAFNANLTFARWLHDEGYRTGFVGKHLNLYSAESGRDPGWTHWNPLIAEPYSYDEFVTYDDGWTLTSRPGEGFLTDYIARDSTRFIQSAAHSGKPFFVWSSYVAPHLAYYSDCPTSKSTDGCWGLPKTAPRHRGWHKNAQSPSLTDPAYDEANVSDKHSTVARLPHAGRTHTQELFQARIRSLAAVDEAVAQTVESLRSTGVLDETLIVFTSDNGYLLGEHRFFGKELGYEQSLRVPMLLRGPGIGAGSSSDETVTHVDLAATFADAANINPSHLIDGKSFLREARHPKEIRLGRDTTLIQAGYSTMWSLSDDYPWFYRGVRTSRYTYVRYTDGFEELFDRAADPAQLSNAADKPAYAAVLTEMRRRHKALEGCAGPNCNVAFGPAPRPVTRR